MYDFHYNFIKKVLMLVYCFDGLTKEIKSKHVYEKFFKNKHSFDLSNYLKDSKLF